MDGDMIFSNNPADYNRVVCMACGAKVKVKLFLAAKAQLNYCTCVSVCLSVCPWSNLNFSLFLTVSDSF